MSGNNHPETHSAGQLGSAVRSAMIWNMASMVFSQLAIAGIFLALTRQLDPHVIGVFTLAAVFVDFIYLSATAALVDAVVQRQDFSHRALSSVFWITLAATVLAALAFAGVSGFIAVQLNAPDLAPVMIALSMTLLPLAFIVGPTALMRQNLDFKGIAVRSMAASLIGGLAALAVTFSPAAPWALVVQRAVQVIVSAVIVTVHTRVLPSFELDRGLLKSYGGSFGRIFAAQAILGAAPRAVDFLVAVFFGTIILGCLRVAMKLVDVLLSALVNPIGQMWVVLLSQAGEAREKRASIFINLSKLTALICLPGFAGVALIANDFTEVALDPAYAMVGPMLTILCGLGLLVPLTNFRNSVLTSLNKLDWLVWFAVADLVGIVLGIVLLAPLGWAWVVFASGIPNFTSLALAFPYVIREMGVTKRQFFAALTPSYAATGLMASGVFAFEAAMPQLTGWTALLAKGALGAALYIGFLMSFYRRWSLDVIATLRARGQAPA